MAVQLPPLGVADANAVDALPAALPPLPATVAIAHRTYRELYVDASRDIFGGEYTAVMEEYETLLAGGNALITPATILTRVFQSADSMPHAYVTLAGDDDDGVGTLLLVHRPAKYPVTMGQLATPWDNRAFAFAGDVQGTVGGFINIVEFPNDAFHVAGGNGVATQLRIPTAAFLDEAFAGDPHVQTVGPFVEGDAGTEVARTRQYMYVPPKYVPILLEQRLSPREAWTRVQGAITLDGAAEACAPLLTWLRATCTIATNRPVPAVQRSPPIVPLADLALQAHRQEILARDLPARTTATPADPGSSIQVAAAIGALASEQRDARAEAIASKVASSAKTPEARWGTMALNLLQFAQVIQSDQLAPVWQALAEAPKRLERQTLQIWADKVANDLKFPSAPIVTSTLATKIVALQLAMTDLDDLEDGVQPFNVGYRNAAATKAARVSTENYDLLLQGSAGATLPDIQLFRDADRVTLPTDVLHVSATLRNFQVLLHLLLGASHVLTVEFRTFVQAWLIEELELLETVRAQPLLPALVLRWLQLRIAHWFRDQARSEMNIPAPDLLCLIRELRFKSQAWYPEFPARYLAPPSAPARPPAAAPGRAAQSSAPGAPPAGGAPSSVPRPGAAGAVHTMVRNPTPDARFAPFRDMNLSLRAVIESHPAIPLPTNSTGTKHCVSYHVKGTCYSSCNRVEDHRVLSAAESSKLLVWCRAVFPPPAAAGDN
jgi:hypothetical protein